jgi:hypothetical protein
VDEDERAGRLGRGPERGEPIVAEGDAGDARRDLDARESGAHELRELGRRELGRLERHGAEHAHALGPQRGEPGVLDPGALEPLLRRDVVAEQVDPRAQRDVVDARLVLGGEDRVEVDEVADRRADRPAAELDQLGAVLPAHPRPPRLAQELRDDHVGVRVDPHAATIRSREPETTSAAPAQTRPVTCSA